jgi:hypothetical protein
MVRGRAELPLATPPVSRIYRSVAANVRMTGTIDSDEQ